jgi:hypothetical protein
VLMEPEAPGPPVWYASYVPSKGALRDAKGGPVALRGKWQKQMDGRRAVTIESCAFFGIQPSSMPSSYGHKGERGLLSLALDTSAFRRFKCGLNLIPERDRIYEISNAIWVKLFLSNLGSHVGKLLYDFPYLKFKCPQNCNRPPTPSVYISNSEHCFCCSRNVNPHLNNKVILNCIVYFEYYILFWNQI